MRRITRRNKYRDQIEDLSDVGHMICALLENSNDSDLLWRIFRDLIRNYEFEGLVEIQERQDYEDILDEL